MLPLSHDEVVHGKGPLIGRMPGDEWQKFANLRLLYGWMYTHPGTKLNFMGGEIGQTSEWKHDNSVEWHLLDHAPHQGMKKLTTDINELYKSEPALYELAFSGDGFEWIELNDSQNSVLSYVRKGKKDKDTLVIVANFTPVVRENYRIGLSQTGSYKEIFNSDRKEYWGSDCLNNKIIKSEKTPYHGRDNSLVLNIPPLGNYRAEEKCCKQEKIMENKYLCIHGHFYQPPRENAWLEEIEIQPSASPYHDWNERINEECYSSNTHSRILNEDSKIIDIVCNYSKMSFNFGPTLLSWMEQNAPDTHQAIIDSDKLSQEIFDGHGSAVAQVYNHLIMPLANRRDKETQVIWGLYDFKKRFGRDAEGIWLAESAVDTETLELCAEHGIKFTILAPSQAKRFRKIGSKEWTNGINSNFHYLYKLPSGKTITLFFYDGERSQGVAFKGLLGDGKRFAEDLVSGFQDTDEPQLVHIATDGESYGHHHKNGDMALAYCMRYIESNNLAKITNYSQYMHLVEAQYEAEIHEHSSWSCAHGVERWKSDCGCHTGGMEGWTQAWRGPLRDALDNLREALINVFEKEIEPLIKSPWEARNAYIDVIFTRTKANIEQFLSKYAYPELDQLQKTRAIRLLEMQRHAQLMYTSCGWFFNELSGIETVQILQYAARAMQLAESESQAQLEESFLDDLDKAQSNIPEMGSGKDIYMRFIAPYKLTLTQVGMHYAVASLFADHPKTLTILNYDCSSVKFERVNAGVQRLAIGTTLVNSKVTLSQKEFSFVVLYLGQHHLIGGTTQALSDDDFDRLARHFKDAFGRSNIARVTDLIKANFKEHNFSFFQMFKDEQLKLVHQFLNNSEDQAYDSYRKIYDVNYNIMNVMKHENLGIPDILIKNLEMVINIELKDTLTAESFILERFKQLVDEVVKWNVKLDEDILNKVLQQVLEGQLREFEEEPAKTECLKNVIAILQLTEKINLSPNLINVQNSVYNLAENIYCSRLVLDNQQAVILVLEAISDMIGIDFSLVRERCLVR